jgi:hypothetical protein
MAEIKTTINRMFMVPTLIPLKDYVGWKKLLDDNKFLNAYTKDATRDEDYENAVLLLFNPPDLDKFREFLDGEYERTKNIITDYDHPNRHIVVVYKLDDKFKKDFTLIRNSKYSRTSPEFQALFPKVVKININGLARDELSLQTRIFKKTPDLRKLWEEKFNVELGDDVEFWEGYNEKNEILTEEILKQYEEAT